MSSPGTAQEFETLLDYLKRTRGFDFSAYKRPSLMRRVEKRMEAARVSSFVDYLDHLEVHPEEFALLFNTILINVSSFFRDQEPWDTLRNEVLPAIVESRGTTGQIRMWSAGCASGEEAYSLAMLAAEILGPERYGQQVKIYATDADEEALAQARQATYDLQSMEAIPAELVDKYFDANGATRTINKDLRRSVIFGRHDLIQDAPISRLDLVACRNTLMYFNAETQARVLARFHFALTKGGILMLGRAETILSQANSFVALDVRRRIFRKLEHGNLRDQLQLVGSSRPDPASASDGTRLRETAADSIQIAQIVVDATGVLVHANTHARSLFSLSLRDLGRPIQDLEVSYRPIELRSAIDRAYQDRRSLSFNDVAWTAGPDGQNRALEVRVMPLYDPSGAALGVSVTAEDVTRFRQLQEELTRSSQELATAMEEVQSSNEELETTNEELQSTVEELETTNEELQSTNEELETMNEELQSSNEELSTINDELRLRSEDLRTSNLRLENILTSLKRGVVVLDRELRVQIWNQAATNLWGLRSEEVVGKYLLGLDIGLPVERLKQPIRDCMAPDGDHPGVVLEATNRRGKSVEIGVACSPLVAQDGTVLGVILLMDEHDHSG